MVVPETAPDRRSASLAFSSVPMSWCITAFPSTGHGVCLSFRRAPRPLALAFRGCGLVVWVLVADTCPLSMRAVRSCPYSLRLVSSSAVSIGQHVGHGGFEGCANFGHGLSASICCCILPGNPEQPVLDIEPCATLSLRM